MGYRRRRGRRGGKEEEEAFSCIFHIDALVNHLPITSLFHSSTTQVPARSSKSDTHNMLLLFNSPIRHPAPIAHYIPPCGRSQRFIPVVHALQDVLRAPNTPFLVGNWGGKTLRAGSVSSALLEYYSPPSHSNPGMTILALKLVIH